MKRSQINSALQRAMDMLSRYRWSLPAWADWSAMDFSNNPETAAYLLEHQLGWDVTDFGSGDFDRCGLTLFCLRNGLVGQAGERTYAEKLLFIEEGQLTPTHCHKAKMEDIINRAGGNLVVEFSLSEPSGTVIPNAVTGAITVLVDGVVRHLSQWQPLVLSPGESVTIPTGLYHRFYGMPGKGSVLVGEVSQVNDDRTDNYFLDPIGRFADIEEDEAPLRRLWNEAGT